MTWGCVSCVVCVFCLIELKLLLRPVCSGVLFFRLNSKWDLRRLCKTVGATALPRLVRVLDIDRQLSLCTLVLQRSLSYRRPLSLRKWDIVTVCTSRKLETHRWWCSSMVGSDGRCLCRCGVFVFCTNLQMCLMLPTEKEDGAIATIVLRGSTDNLMDDVERAVDDGVNTFKVLTRVSIQGTSS